MSTDPVNPDATGPLSVGKSGLRIARAVFHVGVCNHPPELLRAKLHKPCI